MGEYIGTFVYVAIYILVANTQVGTLISQARRTIPRSTYRYSTLSSTYTSEPHGGRLALPAGQGVETFLLW